MNVGVIGAGKFGIAIANQLSLNKKNKVIVLSRCSKKVNSINSHQKVEFYTDNLSKNKFLWFSNEYPSVKIVVEELISSEANDGPFRVSI